MRFTCPTCNQIIQVADEAGGQTIACPTCRQRLKVPVGKTAPEGPRPAPIDKTLLGKEESPSPVMSQPVPRAPEPPPVAPEPPRRRDRDRDDRDWDDDYDRRDRAPRRDRYRDEYRRPNEVNIGLAIASLVCGIVAIVFSWCVFIGPICGLLAIIFGGIHMSNKVTQGNGLAIAGLSTGAGGIVLFIIFLIIALASPDAVWFRRW